MSIKSRIGSLSKRVLRTILASPGGVGIVNALYSSAPRSVQSAFYHHFGRLFWDANANVSGTWKVNVLGHAVRVPIRENTLKLDWLYALSIGNHDLEVLTTYYNYLSQSERPKLFVDMGANYGMHSLIMAKAGLQVFAFEPNRHCVDYGKEMHRENGVQPAVFCAALGAFEGSLDLIFPENETWHGTTVAEVARGLANGSSNIRTESVPVKPLAYYDLPAGDMLIKMDVEGAELAVLQGARETLSDRRPPVIFESNDTASKRDLGAFFHDIGWDVYSLPFDPNNPGNPLADLAATSEKQTNFIALARS